MLRLRIGARPGGIEKNLFLGVSGGLLSLNKAIRMDTSQARPFACLIARHGNGTGRPNGIVISTTKNKNKGTHDNLIQFFLSLQR